MSEDTQTDPQETWACLTVSELLPDPGVWVSKAIAGRVSVESVNGQQMVRVDVPNKDGSFTTSHFSPPCIQAFHKVEEALARIAATEVPYKPAFAHTVESFLEKTQDRLTINTPHIIPGAMSASTQFTAHGGGAGGAGCFAHGGGGGGGRTYGGNGITLGPGVFRSQRTLGGPPAPANPLGTPVAAAQPTFLARVLGRK